MKLNDERRPKLICPDDGRTKQAEAHECNINTIVNKWLKGQQPEPSQLEAFYGDFATVGDYLTATISLIHAQEEFAGLSAEIRSRFQNDPAKLLKFLDDESNRPEAEALGIIDKQAELPLGGVPPTETPALDKEGQKEQPETPVTPTI